MFQNLGGMGEALFRLIHLLLTNLQAGTDSREDGESGEKRWQNLVRQTELTAQICTIMREVKNVRGSTQKKIEKLRHLLSGLLSELTYFDEVCIILLKVMSMKAIIISIHSKFVKEQSTLTYCFSVVAAHSFTT